MKYGNSPEALLPLAKGLIRFGRFGVSEAAFVIRLSSPHMRIVHHFHSEAISDRARFLAEELKLSSIDPILRKKTGLK